MPSRINPSPRALRCRDETPESNVASVRFAQIKNSSPKLVSVVLRPLFSKSATPSSASNCEIAWLKLGCVIQSSCAAFV